MLTILIVEPNVLFRRTLKDSIGSQFPTAEIIESATAEDALHKCKFERPDLVLMDLRLGKCSSTGLDLIGDIDKQHPEAHIVVMTANDEEEYRQAAMRRGADYFLSKEKADEGQKMLALIKGIQAKFSAGKIRK